MDCRAKACSVGILCCGGLGMGNFLEPLGKQQHSHSSRLGMADCSVRAGCSDPTACVGPSLTP